MFNNFFNIQNILGSRDVRKQVNDTDVIVYGGVDDSRTGGYKPILITGEDFKSQVQEIAETAAAEVGETTLTAEATIASGDILTMDSVEQVILPVPAANQYYLIKDIIIEYTHNSIPYTVGGGKYLRIYFGTLEGIDTPQWITEATSLLGQSNNRVAMPIQAGLENAVDAVTRTTHNGQNITAIGTALHAKLTAPVSDGNGSLRIKVEYQLRTFGSEL